MHARWVAQTVELIDGQHPLTPAECCPSALAPRTAPQLVCIHPDSESGLRFCPGHCVHNEINRQKPGPAYAGFRVARADAVASRVPTRPQLAAARARGIENIYPLSLSKFSKQSTRKSEKWVRGRIQFWIEPICRNFDSGHTVRTQNIF